ncbi:MAG: hypothetical protein JOY71_01335 [Acetobacteraceae bacterium]|nr:hypothetical protein [Acetobacteraceae bacterium]
MVALAFPILIGFAALSIDVPLWEGTKLQAQAAAEAAAHAAGLALQAGQSISTEAIAVAASNGFVNGSGGSVVTVNNPPKSGAYQTVSHAIEVIVSSPQKMFFSHLFLSAAPTVSGRAVVSAQSGACVIVLSSSGITMSGGGTFSMPSCDLYNNGSTTVSGTTTVTANDVYLASPPTGTLTVTANTYNQHAAKIADPYASRTTYSCSSSNSMTYYSSSKTYTGSQTLSGGAQFCGGLTLSGSGTLNLNDGVYIFGGSLVASGTWTINSSNATLIFTGSAGITASGTISFNLSAPSSGNSAGLAIWVENGGLTLSGAHSFNVTGAIYVPNGGLTASGVTGTTCAQIVVGSMTTSGTASFNLPHNCSTAGISDVGGLTLVE